jgi:hypothetical protein
LKLNEDYSFLDHAYLACPVGEERSNGKAHLGVAIELGKKAIPEPLSERIDDGEQDAVLNGEKPRRGRYLTEIAG